MGSPQHMRQKWHFKDYNVNILQNGCLYRIQGSWTSVGNRFETFGQIIKQPTSQDLSFMIRYKCWLGLVY